MHGMAADAVAAGQARRLTTVVAADICGYSRLAEIDDEAAVRTVHLVRAAFEAAVDRRRGRVFHSSGDGFLAEFPSATDGVLAALDFVADIKARDTLSPTNPGAKVRVGVHSGDVIEQPNGDLLGHGVNVAARLQQEAEPNGVLASLSVVNLMRESTVAEIRRRGPLALRNIDEPIIAFDIEPTNSNTAGKVITKLAQRLRRIRPLTFWTAAVAAALLATSGATLFSIVSQPRVAEQSKQGAVDFSIFAPGERNYLDRAYLTGVLKSLQASKTDSAAAVLALLESGDTMKAIETLERELAKPNLRAADEIALNHQIGAIAEWSAPAEAVAAYNRILQLDPYDFFAHSRIGQAYLARSEIELALKHFDAAARLAPAGDERLLLQIKTHRAFALNLERRFPEAVAEYEKIIARAVEARYEEQEIHARASLGLALAQADRFDEAKEQLLAALVAQPEDAFLASKARSAWGIGFIARRQGDLDLAERFYARSLELEKKANRAHGIASVLFDMGLNDLARSKDANAPKRKELLARARRNFEQALEITIREKLVRQWNMSLIGLALVNEMEGRQPVACEFKQQSAALMTTHNISIDSVRPEVRAIFSSLFCSQDKSAALKP